MVRVHLSSIDENRIRWGFCLETTLKKLSSPTITLSNSFRTLSQAKLSKRSSALEEKKILSSEFCLSGVGGKDRKVIKDSLRTAQSPGDPRGSRQTPLKHLSDWLVAALLFGFTEREICPLDSQRNQG